MRDTSLPLLFLLERGRRRRRRGEKTRASVWKKKRKRGGERSETRKTFSPWGKFAERPVSGFFSPSFRLANRFENSGRNLGNFATEITPAEISETRLTKLGRFVRSGFVLNFYNERRFLFSFSLFHFHQRFRSDWFRVLVRSWIVGLFVISNF